VLPRADLAVVYGESGSGKSFFVLDSRCRLPGQEWRGKRTAGQGCGLHSAEGAGGFRNRLNAYSAHHNVPLDLSTWRVIPEAPNFMQAEDIKALIAAVKAYGQPDLIVVDTFAQVMPGANENAGEDVGKALGHCRALKRATGAMVVLIHHSGKDASTRGSWLVRAQGCVRLRNRDRAR
jgi:RecA-family ATPase